VAPDPSHDSGDLDLRAAAEAERSGGSPSRDADATSRAPWTEERLARREFCLRLGGVAALAAMAPVLSGCARLLEWSASQERGKPREIKPVQGSVADGGSSGQGTGTTGSATTTGSTEGGAAGSSTTSTAAASFPDLAVFRGDDPEKNVRAALDALGGMERFVRRGANVVLKPNVLTGAAPEYAVTTNPDVLKAVALLCFEAGAASVVVLDRPTSSARTAFEVSGLAKAASEAGATVKYLTDRNFESVSIPKGRLITSWPLVADVFDADVFINLPIAKTHGLAGLTMSMKNLMGIMGGARGTIHLDFDQKIVDVNSLARPHLVVLDAYRILTRNGPTGGNLADVKLAKTVVVGTNQASVDAYGATLFGKTASDLGYLVKAQEQGLGETDLRKLRVQEGKA
jgi:uncharacterized protein (DUF362 family)